MQKNQRANTADSSAGFTLIEILVVMGMLAILTTVVLVAVNPLRQFAQARNSQRQANVATILNAVSNRIADNRGLFSDSIYCPFGLPSEQTLIAGINAHDPAPNAINIRDCLVPTYLSEMPTDPVDGDSCEGDDCAIDGFDTGYFISQDSETSRIKVCAPSAAEPAIEGSREFCLSR